MPSTVIEQLQTFGPENCQQFTYAQAARYTRKLCRTHYENFTVVSWFLPRRLREDFNHVYAFCRWADDLGDETGDPQQSLQLLQWWQHELQLCYNDQPRHPVFVALHQTIRKHDIPQQPFADLIDAFIQDQQVNRYDHWDQLLDYCTRSANPVGRIVLYLCGHRDEQRQRLSDETCTALQLANFWQDVRRDIIQRNRVYIPNDVARKHNLDLQMMVKAVRYDAWGSCENPGTGDRAEQAPQGCGCANIPSPAIHALQPAARATVHELVQRTWPMFQRGRALLPMLQPDVRLDVKLFTLGGEAILKLIRRQNYDTLTRRPRLGKLRKSSLILRALVGKLCAVGGRKP